MATTAVLRHRRDTAANWTSNNPVMQAGQLGYETDTLKFKFGDGSTSWISLSYASSVSTGGISDGDKGDIVVSGSGATWTIDTGVVSTSKMGGDVTTAGKALLDDADATAQRVTLGLGSIATQNANAVSITGGTLTGVVVSTGAYSSNVNETLMRIVRKSTAGTITKGQAVYVVGSTGTHLTVELADASTEATAATTIGVAAESISDVSDGYMIVSGLLTGLSTLPTASFTNGAALWLSETAGALTTTRPTQPAHGVAMGWVINASNGSAGSAYIKIINGQELNELHDVLIVSATANNVLMYDSVSSLWKNRSAGYLSTLITGFASASHAHSTGDITSGNTVVHPELLTFYRETYMQEPSEKRGFDGNYWIWEIPNYNKNYIIVADVARGDATDFSAFHVIDVEESTQVAEYKGQLSTREYGNMLVSAATEYNDALLVIENANVGWATIQQVIERGYKNLYYTPKDMGLDPERYLARGTDLQLQRDQVAGFTMSHKVRPLLISKMELYMREKSCIIRSRRLLDELGVFVWKNARAEAQTGYNDDLVMSWCMGLWVRDTALRLRQQGIELTKTTLNHMRSTGVYKPSYNNTESWKMNVNGQQEDISWLI